MYFFLIYILYMSNLLSIHNSKNQVGIGTNTINVSSDLTIKENTRRYIVCNINNNSLAVHRTIELEDETTLSTVKTHSISSAKLLYIGSNNEISSLALSSGQYLKVSNTGGLVLIDKTAPVLSNPSSIGTITDTTPNLTFTTTETGTLTTSISEGFSSGSSLSITSTGSNTITFATLPSGTYSGKTITLTDTAGNVSNALTIPTFIIDTTAPVLSSASSIGTTNDSTPSLTFSTTETGTLTTSMSEGFSSGSSVSITSTGSNTITFGTLSSGTYSGYTITLTDTAGNASNALTIPTFIIDTIAPVLSNASSIGTTTDTTPTFTFTSSEAGIITSSLSFSTSNSAIVGGNSITFNTLSNSTYSSQWVKVTDTAGNTSNQLTIPSFTVAANPYTSNDIRYYNWIQNGTGDVGYIKIVGGYDPSPSTGPGSLVGWHVAVSNQTYDFGYIVNPGIGATPYSGGFRTWGQGYNNYRYKITRQSSGYFILENVWQGKDFDSYSITGSHPVQWEFIHYSGTTWKLQVKADANSSNVGKYLSARNDSYNWVAAAHGYFYTNIQSYGYFSGWSKQLWEIQFV